jgi:transposase
MGCYMLTLASDVPIYIYNGVADMRKSINGLVLLVVDLLRKDPQAKALYLFKNKSMDRIKGILWHRNGFILLYKPLEKGKFKFPKDLDEIDYKIDSDLFEWLLSGFDFYAIKNHPELKSSQYF